MHRRLDGDSMVKVFFDYSEPLDLYLNDSLPLSMILEKFHFRNTNARWNAALLDRLCFVSNLEGTMFIMIRKYPVRRMCNIISKICLFIA